MGEVTLQLNSPLTDEQWDTITDVDFDHTDRITFHTKHGKEVEFVKSKPIKTNADKYFRNATDEELADWCYEHQEDCLGCPALRKGCMNFGKACKDAWLNWLKQEAESDELLRRDGP